MRWLTFLSLVLLAAGNISAQEAIPMSLENCLQAGLERNKGLDAARAKAEGSLAANKLSRSAMLPSLKMSAGYSRLSNVPAFQITIPSFPSPQTMTISEPVLDNYSIKWTLQQPIFTGGRLIANNKASKYNFLADSSDYNQQFSDAGLNIRSLYWKLYQAGMIKALARENVVLLEEHLKDIGNLAQQGMATENDKLKVKLQLSNATLLLIEAENSLLTAGIQLNNYIGEPLDILIVPTSVPDTSKTTLPSLPDIMKKAHAARADLKAMRLRREAAYYGKKSASAEWHPQVYAVGNYIFAEPNQRIFPTKDQFDGTWDVGVMLSMDIWNWQSTKHHVGQALSVLRQAEDRLFLLEDAIKVEIRLALLELEKTGQKIEVTKTGLAQAEENHRNVKNMFLQGMATNSDLLDAEVLLLQAKVNNTGAVVEYQIAKDKLKKAMGEF